VSAKRQLSKNWLLILKKVDFVDLVSFLRAIGDIASFVSYILEDSNDATFPLSLYCCKRL
jgi:hypothetical protein